MEELSEAGKLANAQYFMNLFNKALKETEQKWADVTKAHNSLIPDLMKKGK